MDENNSVNMLTNNEFFAGTPTNPSFHADTGHWYLAQGVVGINGVSVIQMTSPNVKLPEEQKEA